MTAPARCLRCYREVAPDAPRVVCPECQGVHHDACWNQQGGCGACVPHVAEPEVEADPLPPSQGRDPTLRLTPRQPLAKPSQRADDETVGVRRRKQLEPPAVDPDDTLHIQPDDREVTRPSGLNVAHEDLETAFLKRAAREEDETAVLKREEATAETRPETPGSDVGRAHAGDETVAPSSGSSTGSGSDVGSAAAPSLPPAPAPTPSPDPPPVADVGWWEQGSSSVEPDEALPPADDRVKRASERMRKRASGTASARVSARVRTPGLGRRGVLVLVTLALVGLGSLVGVLLFPDLVAPELLILAPSGRQVHGTHVVVRGRVADAGAVQVQVDGAPTPLFSRAGALEFEAVVGRDALGPTTVLVEVADQAGNTTRRELELECVAPRLELQLSSPEPDAAVGEDAVLVAGRVDTNGLPTSFTVRVGELACPVATDGAFALTVPLGRSPQTLRVVAEGGGVEAAVTRTVSIDRTPPRLELIRPREAITVAASLRFTAQVLDDAPWVDVQLGGAVTRVPRGELWTAVVPLELGENRLRLQAVDAAGHPGQPLDLVLTRLEPLRPRAFHEGWQGTTASWERYLLARRLDPLDDRPQQLGDQGEVTARAFPLLTDFVLARQSWYLRLAAIEALADQVDDAFSEALAARMTEPPLEGVAEGLVRALGSAGDPARVPLLIERLAAEREPVALAAAEALGDLPDPRAVAALIGALEQESRPRVQAALQRSLEALTRHRSRGADAWRGWWSEHADGFSLAGVPAERLGARGEPVALELAGVHVQALLRGEGSPTLVLPELGLETSYLAEALESLEDQLRLVFVTLPAKADFQPPPGDPDDPDAVTPYPSERFCRALESLCQALVSDGKLGSEPVTVIADGTSGWFALTLARLYPERVARLVLLSTPPGHEVWLAVQGRLGRHAARVGDPELARVASAWRDVGAPPSSPFSDEGQALVRAAWTSRFADPRDMAIGRLLGPLVEKRVGGQDYVVRALERPLVGLGPAAFSVIDLDEHPDVETRIVYGQAQPHYAGSDFESMATRLDRGRGCARAVAFPASGGLPALEATRRFCDWLREVVRGEDE